MSRVSWVPLAFGLLAVAGASSAFDPAFVGTRWVIAMAAAVVASGLVASWSVAARTGAITTTLVSAGAAVVVTTVAVLSDTLGQSITTTLSDFLDGVTTGWSDSLQEDLPLVRPTEPLVWASVMVWITAAIVGRALAAGRSSLPVFLAPVLLLGLATAVTVPAGSPSWIPAAVVIVGLLGVLATTSARDIDWSLGQLRATVLVVAIATGAGVFALDTASGDPEGAFDPRTLRSDDASSEEVPDLLAQLDEITNSEPTTALNVRQIDGARPTRLRLAVYDAYDGERWSITTSYREVLQFAPPALLPAGTSSTVRVQVLGSPGPWLPMLDRVTDIRPSVRGWDPDSGTALADSLVATVEGTVVTLADVTGVSAAATDFDPRYADLPPSTPATILEFAATTTAESTDARSAVEALRDALHELGRDDNVPAGHTLGRLASDIDAGDPMAPEQLVALHAILVRALGLPSRIVVGYTVGQGEEVSTTDLIAWTEVQFEGVGWVPFNPVPTEQVRSGSQGESTATTTTLPGQSITQAQVVPRELDAGERNPDDFQPDRKRGLGWFALSLIVAGLIVALVAGVLITRAARRRGRRQASSASWSIAGAWGELLDRLRENSSPSPPNRTVEEAIDQVENLAPTASTSLRELTKLVNVTLYSDTPPSWDDAEQAWGLLRDIERHLRDSQGRSVTFRARLDPRSLRYPTPRPAPQRARRPHPPRPRRTDHPRVQH